jgi:hypothetical protein
MTCCLRPPMTDSHTRRIGSRGPVSGGTKCPARNVLLYMQGLFRDVVFALPLTRESDSAAPDFIAASRTSESHRRRDNSPDNNHAIRCVLAGAGAGRSAVECAVRAWRTSAGEVEGLVDLMVRGSSSPLRRMTTGARLRGFRVRGANLAGRLAPCSCQGGSKVDPLPSVVVWVGAEPRPEGGGALTGRGAGAQGQSLVAGGRARSRSRFPIARNGYLLLVSDISEFLG